jgi:cell division transport system permease protein
MRANMLASGVLSGLRRNAAMTIALVLSTAIALGFVGSALLASTEITKFKQKYENQINVSLYLCPQRIVQPSPCKTETSPAQTAAIKSMLDQDSLVKSTSYISAQRALDLAKEQQPEAAKYLQAGTFPASFTVHLKDVRKDYKSFEAKYSGVTGVSSVNNQFDTINTLLNLIDSGRLFSIIVALVVLIASVLLIANTIQVAANQRRHETSIMRLVGASRLMTELPFILEAVIAAAIGGLISIGFLWVGKRFLLNGVFDTQTKRGVIPNLGINDVLVAGGVGLGVGIVLSALTAFATLRLYVRV